MSFHVFRTEKNMNSLINRIKLVKYEGFASKRDKIYKKYFNKWTASGIYVKIEYG